MPFWRRWRREEPLSPEDVHSYFRRWYTATFPGVGSVGYTPFDAYVDFVSMILNLARDWEKKRRLSFSREGMDKQLSEALRVSMDHSIWWEQRKDAASSILAVLLPLMAQVGLQMKAIEHATDKVIFRRVV